MSRHWQGLGGIDSHKHGHDAYPGWEHALQAGRRYKWGWRGRSSSGSIAGIIIIIVVVAAVVVIITRIRGTDAADPLQRCNEALAEHAVVPGAQQVAVRNVDDERRRGRSPAAGRCLLEAVDHTDPARQEALAVVGLHQLIDDLTDGPELFDYRYWSRIASAVCHTRASRSCTSSGSITGSCSIASRRASKQSGHAKGPEAKAEVKHLAQRSAAATSLGKGSLPGRGAIIVVKRPTALSVRAQITVQDVLEKEGLHAERRGCRRMRPRSTISVSETENSLQFLEDREKF